MSARRRARFLAFGRGGGVLGPLGAALVAGAPCSSQRQRIICSAVAPLATTRFSTFLACATLPARANACAYDAAISASLGSRLWASASSDERVGGTPERDIEQVTEVVRVPRVLRSERDGATIGGHRVAVVAEQRLRETENRPRAIVVGIDLHHATSENRRAPRIAIDRELGKMAMRQDPCVALRLCAARELGEHGQHLVGIERVAQRPFDIPSQGVDVFALCSLAHTTLIAALAEARNGVVAVFRSTVVRT